MTVKNLKVKAGENVFSFTQVDIEVSGDCTTLFMEKSTANFMSLLGLGCDFQVDNSTGKDLYVAYDLLVSSIVYVSYK